MPFQFSRLPGDFSATQNEDEILSDDREIWSLQKRKFPNKVWSGETGSWTITPLHGLLERKQQFKTSLKNHRIPGMGNPLIKMVHHVVEGGQQPTKPE
jgi:hypothetical protein